MILAFDQWLHVQLAQLHGWEVYLLAVLAFSGLYFGSVGLMQGLIRWAQRRQVGAVVTPSFPRSGQVREEIRHSLLSIQVFALQGVGLRVWELMDEETSVSAIVDRLEAEYEVERARLQADVDAFVGTLAEKGLLQGDGQG